MSKVKNSFLLVFCSLFLFFSNGWGYRGPVTVAELNLGIQWYADSTSIFVKDNQAYLIGSSLEIIDVSHPDSPVPKGVLVPNFDAFCYQMCVIDNYAYLYEGGIIDIVNISDPENPWIVNSYSAPEAGGAYFSCSEGGYLFVGPTKDSKINILDVTSRTHPTPVGYIDDVGEHFAIGHGYLFVESADSHSVKIYSLQTNPPLLAGTYNPNDGSFLTVKGVSQTGMLLVKKEGGQGNNGIYIIDVSDAAHPRERGAIIEDYRQYDGSTGNYVLFDLNIYDISDPDNPQYKGRIPQNTDVVFISGNYAYLTLFGNKTSFAIYDVTTDPANPSLVAEITNINDWYPRLKEVAYKGGYAYCATDVGIKVMDVRNPEDPRLVNRFDPAGREYNDLVIDGDYIYAIADHYLDIYDLTDPQHPTLVKEFQPSLSLSYRDDFKFKAICIDNNTAYIAYTLRVNATYYAELMAVDISDPLNPEQLWHTDEIGSNVFAQGLDIENGYAYLAINPFSTGSYYLVVINLENHEVISTFSADDWQGAKKVVVRNGIAYIAAIHFDTKLAVVSVADPYRPTLVKELNWDVEDLAISDHYLYIAGRPCRVVDISNLQDPHCIGYMGGIWYGYGIAVSENYAYVLDPFAQLPNIFKVVDINDKNSLPVVGALELEEEADSIETSGNYAYLPVYSNSYKRLGIVDVSDPASPHVRGITGGHLGIEKVLEIAGDYAYCDSFIADISNPSDPQIINSDVNFNYSRDIGVFGMYAWEVKGTWNDGTIWNVADPANITSVGRLPGGGTAICKDGNKGFVGGGGVRIFDASDPENPVQQSYLHLPHGTYRHGLQVSELYAYLIDRQELNVIFTGTSTPSLVSQLNVWNARRLAVYGHYLFLDNGLVVDVSRPEDPEIYGSFYPGNDLAVSNNSLLVVVPEGLEVIDLSSLNNQPPVIDFFIADPEEGPAPLAVTFTCEAHDPDGSIVAYEVDFGDGSTPATSTDVIFSHTYENAGQFQATCTAYDNNGASVTSELVTITVNAPAPTWQDMTEDINVTTSRTLYDRINRCFFVYLTLTNASGSDLSGPIRMILDSSTIPLLDDSSKPGLDPDGYTEDGKPYFILVPDSESWSDGESLNQIRLDFKLMRKRLNFELKFEQELMPK